MLTRGETRGAFSRLSSGVLNAVAAALLVVGLGAASLAVLTSSQARRVEADQNELRVSLEQLLSNLKDLETGERGFALTGEDPYLTPYDQAVATLPQQLADLTATGQIAPGPGHLAELVTAKRASVEAGTAGLGAVFRAHKPERAEDYVTPATHTREELAWQTPTPVGGVVAAKRPSKVH